MSNNCISCNSPLREGAKFCTSCGKPQTEIVEKKSVETENNLSIVKQKVVWNIQPGEIARSIKEEEFLQYESALGIIVNDGTTAYIKSNGQVIAEIHGGNYDFISTNELNQLLETRIGGASGFLKKGWKFIVNAITGKKIKDQIDNSNKENSLSRLQSLDQVIEHLKRGDIFAITLKQNREFQLVFGDQQDNLDSYANFTPMIIKTKYLDMPFGIRGFFQITDFDRFSSFYLSDNSSVRTNILADKLTPIVKSVLQEYLHDTELSDNHIPEELRQKIEDRLKETDFHGIALKKVIEISTQNEDLDRFRSLSKELYLSEKELDYLHRTNDFKNRLNAAIDDQSVYEAQRELDLYKRLQTVNKDAILTEDELERFYIVLSREKRIFEAQNQEELEIALTEIAKTGMLRNEEFAILEYQVKEGKIARGFALDLTQLDNAGLYELRRLQGSQRLETETLTHDLNQRRKMDDYHDESFHRKRAQDRLTRSDEREDLEYLQNVANQARDSQIDQIRALENIDADMEDRETERKMRERGQEIDFQLRQQQEEHTTERERLHIQKEMTHEQIMAQQAKELSAEAQAEYARSFSAGKDAEKEKELREEQSRFLKEQMEMQQQQSNKMMDTLAQMSGNLVQNRNDQKEEYREQLHREQDRHDKHQDAALNYTTRQQKNQEAPQKTQPVQSAGEQETYKVCRNCHIKYGIEVRFCEKCGNEI